MSRSTRFAVVLLAAAGSAACHPHTYGLTVAPAMSYYQTAVMYLRAEGYTPVYSPGVELAMERQRGDSVDQVRLFHGGGSPALGGFGGSYGTSSWAAYPGGYNKGVTQTVTNTGPISGGIGWRAGGESRLLTLELTTFRVDARGQRHAIEPSDASFTVFDSLIALVQPPDPGPRH